MKKGNLLSKTEMRNVMGGLRNVCDVDECIVSIGDPSGGCGMGFHCVGYDCTAGSRTVNKCVYLSIEPNPGDPVPVD
jgi:hypothetical protein